MFPKLKYFAATSLATWQYNCHAFGADVDDVWWEPAEPQQHPLWPRLRIYWPHGLPRGGDTSLENFRNAHATVGFEVCSDGIKELGIEKIAHYGEPSGRVLHTARQLPWGTWTSKLGPDMDIEHFSAEDLEGGHYGSVLGFMRRPEQARLVPARSQLVRRGSGEHR